VGILTEDMRRVVEAELGVIATVCPDGTTNLSPKGTTAVWDDDHLVFADLRSPGTIANLRSNASIEINVVDQLVCKGYRFTGPGRRTPLATSSNAASSSTRPAAPSRHASASAGSRSSRLRGPCRSRPRPTTSAPQKTSCERAISAG
jgi:predicted pyridoxine 5'-phosphate oxidase superfamily flavin-nucleotide-binding protein